MTIVVIPPSATGFTEVKGIINNNFGEVEQRLQGIEVLSFMRDGTGVPNNSDFNNGDYYINTDDWSLWKKEAGVWSTKTSLAGNPGPKGDDGNPGLIHRGTWNPATAYDINNAVKYRGSYWRAIIFIADGTEPTTDNSTKWELVARGLNPMGAWASGTVYRVDDTVVYNGSTYRVLQNFTSTTTIPPDDTAKYALYVAKGDKGDTGDVGPEGPQGIQGPEGPIGAGLTNRGTWNSATAYITNDAVSYRGAFWAALDGNTNSEPTTANSNWLKITRGLNPVAAPWSTGATYYVDDLVYHTASGSTYRVLTNHTATATTPPNDTTNYVPFAIKGDTGAQGPQGDQGIQGPQGAAGINYQTYKWYIGGTGLAVPRTGTGWEIVLDASRTLNEIHVACDVAPTTLNSDSVVIKIMRRTNGVLVGEVGRVLLGNGIKRNKVTGLSVALTNADDLRVDFASNTSDLNIQTGPGNVTVIARAT